MRRKPEPRFHTPVWAKCSPVRSPLPPPGGDVTQWQRGVLLRRSDAISVTATFPDPPLPSASPPSGGRGEEEAASPPAGGEGKRKQHLPRWGERGRGSSISPSGGRGEEEAASPPAGGEGKREQHLPPVGEMGRGSGISPPAGASWQQSRQASVTEQTPAYAGEPRELGEPRRSRPDSRCARRCLCRIDWNHVSVGTSLNRP